MFFSDAKEEVSYCEEGSEAYIGLEADDDDDDDDIPAFGAVEPCFELDDANSTTTTESLFSSMAPPATPQMQTQISQGFDSARSACP